MIKVDGVDIITVDHPVIVQAIVGPNRDLGPYGTYGPRDKRDRGLIAELVSAIS